MNIESKLRKIENAIKNLDNPLFQMRKDLKEILEIKKMMDHQNCYNTNEQDSKRWFGGKSKKDCINEGYERIKSIIIDLAKKYKKEKEGN
jgi:hypothetical protein